MLGDLNDEEANDLIALFSKSLVGNIILRDFVGSKIFPVDHYIINGLKNERIKFKKYGRNRPLVRCATHSTMTRNCREY